MYWRHTANEIGHVLNSELSTAPYATPIANRFLQAADCRAWTSTTVPLLVFAISVACSLSAAHSCACRGKWPRWRSSHDHGLRSRPVRPWQPYGKRYANVAKNSHVLIVRNRRLVSTPHSRHLGLVRFHCRHASGRLAACLLCRLFSCDMRTLQAPGFARGGPGTISAMDAMVGLKHRQHHL